MRPSWIAGVVATTLLLGLSACSDDESDGDGDADDAPASPAAASPTAASPAATTSPVDDEPAPEPPEAADTRKAREAFARFVVETWGYALRHNDPDPVVRLSPGPKQPCAGCEELEKELSERRDGGWYVDFPGAEVRRLRLTAAPDPGVFLASATIDIPASLSYFEDGSVRNDNDAHRGATFELLMRRDGKQFDLLGFQLR